MRWLEWWNDAMDGLRTFGRRHLPGIAAEVLAVFALVITACLLALVAAGGRL